MNKKEQEESNSNLLIQIRFARRAGFPAFVYPEPLVGIFADELFYLGGELSGRFGNVAMTVAGV